MQASWNEGYFTESTYTYGYYREINPVFQNFCLLSRGFAVNSGQNQQGPQEHCELGFGQGISINLHAASQNAGWHGTDFNPAHAAHARELATASKAKIHNDSFAELLARDDLPQFDSISLHGIWAWISRENRQVIVDFAAKHLKPGGLLFVSYNCFPGWSPAAPLRQLFYLHNRFLNVSRDTHQQVQAALDFTSKLLAAKPAYANAVPQIQARLENISKQDYHYLAHEYFNEIWDCMYFTDVVDAMAQARLDFACSANPLDAVDAVNLSAEAVAFLNTIENPVAREQARDYFVNNQFRKDLYVKGLRRLNANAWLAAMREQAFVLLVPAEAVPMEVTGAAGKANLLAEVYQPVLGALAGNACSPKRLAEIESGTRLSVPQLVQALQVLVGAGFAAPCQAPDAGVKAKSARINAMLCQRAHHSNDVSFLASPVLGGGVNVSRFEQVFLATLAKKPGTTADALARLAWGLLKAQNQHLLKEGRELTTEEENLGELQNQAAEFLKKRLPILKALQIAVE